MGHCFSIHQYDFNALPFDIQNEIIQYLSFIEYSGFIRKIKMHPLLYLKLREEYYYLPSVKNCYDYLIVNSFEHQLMMKSCYNNKYNKYIIINYVIIRYISIYMNKYIHLMIYSKIFPLYILLLFIFPPLFIDLTIHFLHNRYTNNMLENDELIKYNN
jgi:hypothetical protein